MQYGIYYAYWETEWGGNFVPYVEKCARLGFDVLEVACGAFDRENDAFFHELAAAARANGMTLTGGYGPRKEHDLATADNAQAEQTFRFYADMFRKMELAGIDRLGGALYSYWPAHGTPQTDKAADTARSVRRMQRLADLASDHGITLGMEALNRFEGYLINTAQECIDYVRAVDRPNVKDKFVAVIGGGAERFCLALQKVQAREDGGLRTAAGDEIHVLQAAGFIKFLLELGTELFDFHD